VRTRPLSLGAWSAARTLASSTRGLDRGRLLPALLSRRRFACCVLHPRVRCCTSQLGALLRRRVPLPELHKAMFERVDPVRFQKLGLSHHLPACRQYCNLDHLIDLHHVVISVYLLQPVHASAPSTPPPNRIDEKQTLPPLDAAGHRQIARLHAAGRRAAGAQRPVFARPAQQVKACSRGAQACAGLSSADAVFIPLTIASTLLLHAHAGWKCWDSSRYCILDCGSWRDMQRVMEGPPPSRSRAGDS